MKTYIHLFLVIFLIANGLSSLGQSMFSKNDLHKAFQTTTNDSIKTFSAIELAKHYCYNNTDSTIYFAEKAIQSADKAGDSEGLAWAYNVLGNAYYVNGTYDLALSHYKTSLKLFKSLDNKNRIAWSLNNIGLIYLGQEKFKDAINVYKKLFNDLEFAKDSTLQTTAFFNIAVCYDLNGDHEIAITYLDKALPLSLSTNNLRLRNLIINRMGETYHHLNNFKKARLLYNQVISFEDYQNNWELGFSHAGLAQCYLSEGNTQKAIHHAKKSFEYAQLVNAKWDAAKALKIITDSYAKENEYKEAYNYYVLYEAYKDSLYSEKKEREINYALLKLSEAEKGELKTITELQQQKLNFNRTVNYGVAVAAFSLSFLGFILYKNARQRNRLNRSLLRKNSDIARQKELISQQKDYLEALNKTKDRLFSIISHDLKSPLSSIAGTLEIIRLGSLNPQEQTLIFKSLHSKVLLVSQMLHNLLHWANTQQMGIKTKPSKVHVLHAVEKVLAVAELIAEEKGIKIIHHSTPSEDIFADEDHFVIILQNLLGNSIKFTPPGGTIIISYQSTNDLLIIAIEDNGIGIPENKIDKLFNVVGADITVSGTNKEGGTGIGLMLVQQFIKANNGILHVTSEVKKGTKITIALPKFTEQEVVPVTVQQQELN